MATQAQLDDTLNQLAEIAKPLVQSIEAKPAATKDRYGDYMVAIQRMAEMVSNNPRPSTMLGIGVAMQRAGANKAGVKSALRVLGAI